MHKDAPVQVEMFNYFTSCTIFHVLHAQVHKTGPAATLSPGYCGTCSVPSSFNRYVHFLNMLLVRFG